jgi:hypothetical protein
MLAAIRRASSLVITLAAALGPALPHGRRKPPQGHYVLHEQHDDHGRMRQPRPEGTCSYLMGLD